MLFTSPIPFREALQSRAVKQLMPTAATARQIEALEPQIRERAAFMARVNHAGTVGQMHEQIGQILGSPQSAIGDRQSAILDPATARLQLKQYLASIGYDPETPPQGFEPAQPGSLRDIASDARLNLVIDTNLKMAYGYGQFAKANDLDILDDYPCWELVRNESRKEERSWRERWVGAGGKLYGSTARMIARKDDSIWSNLGPFKLPYPPFDYNSGMGVEEVDREEAEALGVIKRSTTVAPQSRGFNDDAKGAIPGNLTGKLLDVAAQFLSLKNGAFVPRT